MRYWFVGLAAAAPVFLLAQDARTVFGRYEVDEVTHVGFSGQNPVALVHNFPGHAAFQRVRAYNPNGTPIWEKNFSLMNEPVTMVTCPNGYVAVFGNTLLNGRQVLAHNWFTPAGTLASSGNQFYGESLKDTTVNFAVADDANNVYVAGQCIPLGGSTPTAFLAKWNRHGPMSVTYFPTDGRTLVDPRDLSVNSDGEAALVVESNDTKTVWRVNAAGVTQWVKPAYWGVIPATVKVLESGDTVIGGKLASGPAAMQKLDANGLVRWTRSYDVPNNGGVGFDVLAVNSAGSVAGAGNKGSAFLTVGLDMFGQTEFERDYTQSAVVNKGLNNLWIDSRGYTYILAGNTRPYWISLKPDGTTDWISQPYKTSSFAGFGPSAMNPADGSLFAVYYLPGGVFVSRTTERAVTVTDSFSAVKNVINTCPTSIMGNDVHSADGTPVIVTAAQHGQVVLKPDGTFTYQPAPNYTGPDSFVYQITKWGLSPSNPAHVNITVQ